MAAALVMVPDPNLLGNPELMLFEATGCDDAELIHHTDQSTSSLPKHTEHQSNYSDYSMKYCLSRLLKHHY